jgi:putative peptide zinc metalloprotease protein
VVSSVERACFQSDARVAVARFLAHRDGDSATIADPGRAVFVSIPESGLHILETLSAGRTVGEAASSYERAYGETPDIEEFLNALAAKGFVAPWDGSGDQGAIGVRDAAPAVSVSAGRMRLGRRVFGGPALVCYSVVIGLGLMLVGSDPGVIPGPHVLVFGRHAAAMLALILAINVAAVAVHESSHVLAAWACGVPARVRPGRRLWFPVVQTDMTGVWLAAKRARYVAFLAGPMSDAVSATLLVAALWADRRGLIGVSANAQHVLSAVLFGHLMRLLWQCFVFVRTDFYYVVAARLDCKRLLADTEDLLANLFAALCGRGPRVDQSAIPSQEMRAIRAYTLVWVGGRLLALAWLVLITIPVLAAFTIDLTGAHTHDGTLDFVLAAGVGVAFQASGLLAWVVSLCRSALRAHQTTHVGGELTGPHRMPRPIATPVIDRPFGTREPVGMRRHRSRPRAQSVARELAGPQPAAFVTREEERR